MPAPIRKLHSSCFRPSRINFGSRFTLLETRHFLDAFPAGLIIVVGPYQTDIGSRLRRKAAHGSHSRDFPVPRLGVPARTHGFSCALVRPCPFQSRVSAAYLIRDILLPSTKPRMYEPEREGCAFLAVRTLIVLAHYCQTFLHLVDFRRCATGLCGSSQFLRSICVPSSPSWLISSTNWILAGHTDADCGEVNFVEVC